MLVDSRLTEFLYSMNILCSDWNSQTTKVKHLVALQTQEWLPGQRQHVTNTEGNKNVMRRFCHVLSSFFLMGRIVNRKFINHSL